MGWTFCRDWTSKQDVIDDYVNMAVRNGYTVQTQGNWIYAEEKGKPVDLIYLMTNKCDGEWGYKAISVSCGPVKYNAPLSFVIKIHQVFQNDEYYQGWLSKYQKRESVLQSNTPSLFEEGAA